MTEETEFQSLISRLRAGDEDAAATLVRQCEPEIRRFIRFRLTDPSLRRFVDSLDICQSVLSRFFVHIAAGEFELNSPQQLRSLLLAMARNSLYDQIREQHAERRDTRRLQGGEEPLEGFADNVDTPSQFVATRELLAAIDDELSEDDRKLVYQRMEGRDWSDLAAEHQASSEALRKRVTRVLDKVAKKLGFASDEHN